MGTVRGVFRAMHQRARLHVHIHIYRLVAIRTSDYSEKAETKRG